MEHRIVKVLPGSVAEELSLEAGDVLLSANGEEIEDVFDFEGIVAEGEFTLLVRKTDGEEWEVEIEMDEDEELGLVFENDLMSDYKGCQNRCLFCFIDQMPPNMRETLYFKDDDSRLSFLQGNYITLTNMSEHDVERIIRYHMEPMNISVHTTNPELRVKMLRNRFAGEKLGYLDRFYEAGLVMNGQIVLCKGINDGEELRRTVYDLMKYAPVMQSLSVVPVGLTKYRENLPHLEAFTREDALSVISIVEEAQKAAFSRYGLHFVHASDELYLLAGKEFPEEARYDGYLQIENGVGMARSLLSDAERVLWDYRERGVKKKKTEHITIATGLLAAPILKKVKAMTEEIYGPVDVSVIPVENRFFGPNVTVAGLLTGRDIIDALKPLGLSGMLVLPSVMFRYGEEVFLDDVTRTDAEKELSVPVKIVETEAWNLIDVFLGYLKESPSGIHGQYELPRKESL